MRRRLLLLGITTLTTLTVALPTLPVAAADDAADVSSPTVSTAVLTPAPQVTTGQSVAAMTDLADDRSLARSYAYADGPGLATEVMEYSDGAFRYTVDANDRPGVYRIRTIWAFDSANNSTNCYDPNLDGTGTCSRSTHPNERTPFAPNATFEIVGTTVNPDLISPTVTSGGFTRLSPAVVTLGDQVRVATDVTDETLLDHAYAYSFGPSRPGSQSEILTVLHLRDGVLTGTVEADHPLGTYRVRDLWALDGNRNGLHCYAAPEGQCRRTSDPDGQTSPFTPDITYTVINTFAAQRTLTARWVSDAVAAERLNRTLTQAETVTASKARHVLLSNYQDRLRTLIGSSISQADADQLIARADTLR